MRQDSLDRMLCLTPLLGMGVGIMFAPFLFEQILPTELENTRAGMWFIRGSGVGLSLIFWSLFVFAARSRRLHCGGTEELRGLRDRQLHYVYWVSFVVLYIGSLLALNSASIVLFLLLMGSTIFAVLSTVGWGSPIALLVRFRL